MIREKEGTVVETRRIGETVQFSDSDSAQIQATLDQFEQDNAIQRMWSKDATVWKEDADAQKIINNALGWLRVPEFVQAHLDELKKFAADVKNAGFEHILVMGMGGSSLCVEVLNQTHRAVPGYPKLLVLDSTVPATIHRISSEIDPAKTLFIVSSKSGTTTEPTVFYAYFFDKVKQTKGDQAGENFVAITDPGTKMEADAKRDNFRHIFLNPSDIGGRYSALSYFGMVPAALKGLDVELLLTNAQAVAHRCGPDTPIAANPGATLGASMGTFALAGRDKVTLVTPEPLPSLGLWIEQIIAESTGKEGKGILPVAGEPVGPPEVYGQDRFFVQVRTKVSPALADCPELMTLAEAGHPVMDLMLEDNTDIGAEFFRWEIATPLAGKVIGINPFDQPNVQESKDNTKELLETYQKEGKLKDLETVAGFDGLTLLADEHNKSELLRAAGELQGRDLFVGVLKAHFARVKTGDYVAITQYVDETPARDEALLKLRKHLRDALKVATTTGYGPRFLHSTGQLHKGGGDNGVFLQMTADDGADLPIPDPSVRLRGAGQGPGSGRLPVTRVAPAAGPEFASGKRCRWRADQAPRDDSRDHRSSSRVLTERPRCD